jgi:hypothetical protein
VRRLVYEAATFIVFSLGIFITVVPDHHLQGMGRLLQTLCSLLPLGLFRLIRQSRQAHRQNSAVARTITGECYSSAMMFDQSFV